MGDQTTTRAPPDPPTGEDLRKLHAESAALAVDSDPLRGEADSEWLVASD
jgi:hypothetical protein